MNEQKPRNKVGTIAMWELAVTETIINVSGRG